MRFYGIIISMFKSLKNFFLPHEDNDHHPHVWRMPGTLFFLGTILVVESYFFVGSYFLIKGNNYLAAVFPSALVAFTNDIRADVHEKPLTENQTLVAAAQLKADDMASRGYFAHYTPEGLAPWSFIEKAGYAYSHAGENLAVNFVDSKDVVDAWVASPTHYKNLVKDNYTEIGIATAEGVYQGRKTIFIVEFFGTPAVNAINEGVAVETAKTLPNKVAVAPKTAQIEPKASPAIVVTNPVSSTTEVENNANKVVAVSTTSQPSVQGLESDKVSDGAPLFLSYPRHIVSIFLTLLLIAIFVLLFTSIKSHNKEHHNKIIQIAFWFVLIILLAVLLNFFFAKGII
jgi:uncharacterized protein YkwD